MWEFKMMKSFDGKSVFIGNYESMENVELYTRNKVAVLVNLVDMSNSRRKKVSLESLGDKGFVGLCYQHYSIPSSSRDRKTWLLDTY